MRADEALSRNNGNPIYAVFHNDLLRLWQRDDGQYVIHFTSLENVEHQGTYVNKELTQVLTKDKRWLAEWYLTEQEAFNGKQPEEFYIYTGAIYQHKDTKQIWYAKFRNGEILFLSTHKHHDRHKHATSRQEDVRHFLLNYDEYEWLSSYWLQTRKQSEMDVN